ncbi:MAG: hypothetical protein AAGJ87_05935, partial [Pseudomonadota bacterium]
ISIAHGGATDRCAAMMRVHVSTSNKDQTMRLRSTLTLAPWVASLAILAAAAQRFATSGDTAWLGAVVAAAPHSAWLARAALTQRTRQGFDGLILASGAGVMLSALAASATGALMAPLVASGAMLILLLSVFVYARHGRSTDVFTEARNSPPHFHLTTETGALISSQDLIGRKTLFVFHGGSASAAGVEQLSDIASQLEHCHAGDATAIFVGPTPSPTLKAMGASLFSKTVFAKDPEGRAARAVAGSAIFDEADFSLAIVAVDTAGKIVSCEQDKGVCARPEPKAVLRVRDRSGPAACDRFAA